MRISINATSCRESASKRLAWTVDISRDGCLMHRGIEVEEPLDKKEKALCRWYMDKYRQKEPYSTTKAKKAAGLLRGYGKQLKDQLQLEQLLGSQGESVRFQVEEETALFGASIHQLYWECLEDPALWCDGSTVTLERSVSEDRCAMTSEKRYTRSLHILVVTARDLTRDRTADADISPALIPDILWKIQDDLHEAYGETLLNIEMVRPATFEALRRHTQRKNGNEVDIVHFDMHGTVCTNSKEGTPTGYLHFNDPDSDTTQLIDARTIMDIFQHQPLRPSIVLNACDSAVATRGDAANIAGTFARSGHVSNVLAMAHRASESATKKFFEGFYDELLVNRSSFRDSARLARSALRKDPMRDARFHAQVEVVDWAVPVVYSAGPDLVPETLDGCSGRVADRSVSKEQKSIVGREFDYMRVEKLLLGSGRMLYLHGERGVGKTAFLRQLSSRWVRSSLCKTTVYLDFSSRRLPSGTDCLQEILAQIGGDVGVDGVSGEAQIRQAISHKSIVLVLDGIFDITTSQRVQSERTSQALQLLQLIGSLSDDLSESQNRMMVITSGRAVISSEIKEFEGKVPISYELEGLKTADGVALVREFTGSFGQSPEGGDVSASLTENWEAEPLVHLMQGNSLALTVLAGLAKKLDMPVLELCEILQGEDPILGLDASLLCDGFRTAYDEFIRIVETLEDDELAVWVILSWFWHQGPSLEDFTALMRDGRVVDNETTVLNSVSLATSWSFIEVSSTRISKIDPLFTMFIRIYVCSSSCRLQLSSNSTTDWHRFSRLFSQKVMHHPSSNGSPIYNWSSTPSRGLEYAVQLTKTVLSTHPTRDTNERFFSFLVPFFRTVDKLCEPIVDKILRRGTDYDGYQEECDRLRENFLFCIGLCCGRGVFPLPHLAWPKELIFTFARVILRSCNIVQITLVADKLEQILQGLIQFSKLARFSNVVQDDGDLCTINYLCSTLAEIHRRHIPGETGRDLGFIKTAQDILDASESQLGVTKDPNVMAAKSHLQLTLSQILLQQRKPDESREALRRFQTLNKDFNLDPTVQANLAQKMAGMDPETASTWTSFARVWGGSSMVEDIWTMAASEAMGYDPDDINSEESPPLRSRIRAAPHPVEKSIELTLRYQRYLLSPSSNLKMKEVAMDRGDWASALATQNYAVAQGLAKLDWDQIREQAALQRQTAARYGILPQFEQKFKDAEEMLGLFERQFEGMLKGDLSKDEVLNLDKVMQKAGRTEGVDVSGMKRMTAVIMESWDRDMDASLPHNSTPGILSGNLTNDMSSYVTKYVQKHVLRAANSKEYNAKILNSIADVLETLVALEKEEDKEPLDDEAIFRRLDELQRMAGDDLTELSFKEGGLDERRTWDLWHCFQRHRKQLEGMEISTFAGTQKCLDVVGKMKKLLALYKPERASANSEVVQPRQAYIDAAYASIVLKQAELVVQGDIDSDSTESRLVFHTLLKLYKEPSQVQGSKLRARIESTLIKLYQHTIGCAATAGRWIDAATHIREWRQHPALWARVAGSRDIRFIHECERMAYAEEYMDAMQELDFTSAKKHLARLKDMRERHEALGEDTDDVADVLGFGDFLINMTMMSVATGGPEAARKTMETSIALAKSFNPARKGK